MGMQIGLKPQEVLDMSLDVFRACSRGYSSHMFDMQILGVQQGYWAGYYSRSKKPKSVKTIIDKMVRSRGKSDRPTNTTKPDVDVEAFLKMEEQFNKRLNK